MCVCQSQSSNLSLPSDLEHKFVVTLYISIGYLLFTFAVEIPAWHSASLEEVWELPLRLTVPLFPLGGGGLMVPLARLPDHLLHHPARNCSACLLEAPKVTYLISRLVTLPLVYVCKWSKVVN